MPPIVTAVFVCAGTLAGAWLGVPGLRPIAGDVIAACAILAAFAVQLMFFMATVLSPGRVSRVLFDEIAQELDARQAAARRLFLGYASAVAVFLALKLTGEWKPGNEYWEVASSLAGGVALGIAAYAFVGTWAFMQTLRTLQDLRHRLIRQELTVRELASRAPSAAQLDHLAEEPHNRPFGGTKN